MPVWKDAVSSTHPDLVKDLEVSDEGQVRVKSTKRVYKGTSDEGKPTITRERVGLRVHHLVAETFIARRDALGVKQIKHKDGNYLNNAVSNLEYVSNIGHNGKSAGQKRFLTEKIAKLKEDIEKKQKDLAECEERLAKFPTE